MPAPIQYLHVIPCRLAEKWTIQPSYAIGVARSLSIYADTFGTGQASKERTDLIDLLKAAV